MKKQMKLRKIRVLGIVIMMIGIVMLLTSQSWAAAGIAVSDSGLYIMTGWFVSLFTAILGLLFIILG